MLRYLFSKKILVNIFFCIFIFRCAIAENNLVIEVAGESSGKIEITLLPDLAPLHVERIKTLVNLGAYDGVVFHRVIEGFMAQTGDVKFGNTNSPEFNLSLAGTGGSDLPNLKAEFTDIAHTRGILSAARSADPDSANSQFFICFESAPHLDRQYSAFGKVIKGIEFIDQIKKGDPNSGAVSNPDKIISIKAK